MRQKDPAVVAQRQIANVQQATTKIQNGVNAVTRSPGQAAADNIQVMIQNFLAKAQSGELEAALRSIDLDQWKQDTLAGIPRIGPGMERKRAVIVEFHRQLQAYQLAYTREIDDMPSGNLEASRARMNTNFDRMSEFEFQKGRS